MKKYLLLIKLYKFILIKILCIIDIPGFLLYLYYILYISNSWGWMVCFLMSPNESRVADIQAKLHISHEICVAFFVPAI